MGSRWRAFADLPNVLFLLSYAALWLLPYFTLHVPLLPIVLGLLAVFVSFGGSMFVRNLRAAMLREVIRQRLPELAAEYGLAESCSLSSLLHDVSRAAKDPQILEDPELRRRCVAFRRTSPSMWFGIALAVVLVGVAQGIGVVPGLR